MPQGYDSKMSHSVCIHNVPVIYSAELTTKVSGVIRTLEKLVETTDLKLKLVMIAVEQKLNQKLRKQLSDHYAQPIFVIDEKLKLSLLTHSISVAPEWNSLQRRVVSAGRKSELLLQACKLTDQSKVLDATAGFGHDSLILASTGAQVTMLERNPLMALLLLYEQQLMLQQPNWQKLMARLDIVCAESSEFMKKVSLQQNASEQNSEFDVIYLDPMFPENSYTNKTTGKGAKVGKHMQALQHIAQPPDINEEERLLQLALNLVKAGGRVVIKRPSAALLFADSSPDESWHNEILRFDAYFKKA